MRKPIVCWLLLSLSVCTLAACDKKSEAAPAAASAGQPQASPAAAPPAEKPAAAEGKSNKCKQAAEHKAKLKDPNADPNTLGSVSFDIMDCEGGKWSDGKADCILAAKDYDTAKQCE